MKTKVVLFIAAALLSVASSGFAPGQSKTEKFKVNGNCGMCENRIEKAAKTVEGVSAAEWDKKSLMLTVSYDQSKTEVDKVHTAIAKAGHDTELHKGSDEKYGKLHGCCKYKRAKVKSKGPGSENAVPPCSQGAGNAGCCAGSIS